MSGPSTSELPTPSQDRANLEQSRSIWDWFPTVQMAPIGVFRSTPDGRFTYVNGTVAKIFEFDSEKEMEEKVTDIANELLVNSEQRIHFTTVLEQNGTISDFIYEINTKHNNRKYVSLTARLVKTENDDVFYEGFLIDVTEQRETKSRLERLLRDVQGMSFKCIAHPPWQMLWISDGCGELTGYSKEDFMSRSPDYETIIDKEYRNEVALTIANSIRTRTTYSLFYRITTASGEKKWVFEKGKLSWDADDKPLHIDGFITSANHIGDVESRRIQEIERQERFQKIRFRVVLLWTFIIQFIIINLAVLIVLGLKASGLATNIGQAELIGFFGQTVAQVAGLVYLIAKYLFTVEESVVPKPSDARTMGSSTSTHGRVIHTVGDDDERPTPAQLGFGDEERPNKKGNRTKLPQQG